MKIKQNQKIGKAFTHSSLALAAFDGAARDTGGHLLEANGKLLAESRTGVPNRAGGQPRGGHLYADMRGEFKGGKVTVAATSFLQFNRRGSEGRPMGHLTLWLEEQKLPPLE